MIKLSNRIVNLNESDTLKMAALARQLQSQGIKVINLSLGEPDFDTPEHIKEAAKQAIDQNYSHYTPVSGYLDVRQAVVHKLKRDNGLDYTPEQIVLSTGAKQSIANVVLCLVNPGDEVLLPSPYWVSYAAQVELAEGIATEVPASMENGFKITAQQLEAAIKPNTRLIIFSSPCNPTGAVYSKEELRQLAEVIVEHNDLYVVSDEIYEYINYVGKHESMAQFEFAKHRVITVNGLSKGFAMTGWRLGYIAAPLAIAKACDKMQGQFTSATCSITQRAAIAALTGTMEPVYAMQKAFRHRRDLMLDLLNDMPGFITNIPDGAFYVFPDVSYYLGKTNGETIINNVDDLSMYLLNHAHVSTVNGQAFGNEKCIRISYAASEDNIREACARMKQHLAKLY
ncbi:pyridoxal phosphate-dependent aminotransferase [Sphingobacteriales bacterium UPWRP_1]|nr:aspartate aminotransferase [Sphingobacteriales bacterium TSM_CSS]PSJ75933.1 pyridoxal phosphate-dependent aminotransferase [Sphingobacteriales bacterium UPWRP_1]